MEKKLYSLEYISKIYNVDVEKLQKFTLKKNEGDSTTELPASLNNEIADFLGVVPIRLNKNRTSKKSKVLGRQYLKEIEDIKNARYKERIMSFVTELNRTVKNSTVINNINQAYGALPTKNQYLAEYCEKKYFTWDNIIFTEKGIKIDPNIAFLSIDIDGPTYILNNIKASYFQKKYGKELYKVYVNKLNSNPERELSSDIQKIKKIVTEHINNVKKEKFKETSAKKKNNKLSQEYEISKQIGLKDISLIFKDNQYIKETSKLMKTNGKAISLWENNNSVWEESILIILPHKIFTFVIWENINDNRACYIFKYKNQNLKRKIKDLEKFINSNIEYKRRDLRNNYNNGSKNSLEYEKYYTIIHEDINGYVRKLNSYLKP